MVQILICFLPFVMFDSKNCNLLKHKKERGTLYKNKTKTTQIVHVPFTCYQYVIKKITALNSIHKSTTLTCQNIFNFFWKWKLRAGKLDKNISPVPSFVHAHFTCYEYVLKKFTALNYTNKTHDSCMPI